MPDGTVYEG